MESTCAEGVKTLLNGKVVVAMIPKKFESYNSVQRMLNRLKAQARAKGRDIDEEPTSTLRIFPHYVRMFCERVAGKDPDTLILERKLHLKSDDDFVRRQHEELATKFINLLGKEGASSNTIATALGAVKAFYQDNYVPLVGVIVPSGLPERRYRLPSPEELRGIVEAAPLRTATWIVCQKDSGMGIGDLIRIGLNWESPVYGTIKEQLRSGLCPIHLHVVRKKVMRSYFDSWLGEDSVAMLNEYVDFSRRRIFDVAEKTVREDAKKAGIVGGTHILRKFFTTYVKISVASALYKRGELDAAGVSDTLVEYWAGHSLGKVKGAYNIPPIQLQKEIYTEAYPRIRIL